MEDIKQLKCENETLSLENKRLTEKIKNTKEFVKVYFKDQLNRIKEIEKNGIYNAETFSYLVGDIGRSLYNTTLNETNNDPTTNKKPSQGRLSTNKENRRARYEDVVVEPSKDCRISCTTSNKNNKQTTINVGKWQDIFYNGKSNNEQQSNKNKQTLGSTAKPFSNQEHFKNLRIASNKNFDQEIKNSKPQETQNFLDPDLTLCLPIGPPFKSSTQIESDKNKEKFNNTTQNPSKEILKNQKAIPNAEDGQFLDPDMTLRSPIGPPSKSSTPQGPSSGEQPKKFTLAFSPPPTSPSLLSNEDSERLRCTLLPQIISMEGEVPVETQPKSPTILTRSHSFTRTTILVAASPDLRTPKRKRNNMSFGSLLASESPGSKQVIVNDSAVLGEHLGTRLSSDDESRNQPSKMPAKNHTLSPDIIVLDDSDFAKPNSTGVPRKKSKTSVANESALNTSSLLFFSPQTSNSPVPSSSKTLQSDNESNEMRGNEEIDQVFIVIYDLRWEGVPFY
ncbi:Hypothetical predicted protein [Paramuricea clavata]|uniref:Uncharacterized protein n=1 Tax=Paramuricea clavata TaxID=317549 RepID=A0A6S7JKS2_PARCT|nr:Hypothetical predicted protein [Paramuricea clavata]